MRVTFATVNRNVQKNLSRQYGTMVNLQEQLATGKRLRKPSDHPVDVANDIKLRSKQVQLKQYKRNIEDGLANMGVAASAMSSMNEMLHRARELAVQAANGTYTDTDRMYMQQEVDQIYRQMMSVVNTQFKGNFIFNGTNGKTPPYNIASSPSQASDYVARNMATYGSEFDISLRNTADSHDPADTIYIDYPDSNMAIGTKLQLKWSTDDPAHPMDGEALGNVFPETFPLDEIYVADAIFPGNVLTFNKDVDYVFDHKTGEITIISENLRDAVNRVRLSDNPLVDPRIDQRAGADFTYSLTDTFQVITGKFGEPIRDIFPGSFTLKIGNKEYLEGFGEYKPGYYDKDGVYHKGENVFDYSVDYETGKITIYNMEILRDMRPDWLISGDYRQHNSEGNPYNPGQLTMNFDYITRGTNHYGEKVTAAEGDIKRAIEMGIAESINMRADDMLRDRATGNDMVGVLLRYSQALLKDDRDAIQRSLDELDSMYNSVLNSQSQIGAKIYRFELTLKRNEEMYVEVSQQQSALEDADLAEVISKLLLAENVYNASLQAAMRVIQPSLANYM